MVVFDRDEGPGRWQRRLMDVRGVVIRTDLEPIQHLRDRVWKTRQYRLDVVDRVLQQTSAHSVDTFRHGHLKFLVEAGRLVDVNVPVFNPRILVQFLVDEALAVRLAGWDSLPVVREIREDFVDSVHMHLLQILFDAFDDGLPNPMPRPSMFVLDQPCEPRDKRLRVQLVLQLVRDWVEHNGISRLDLPGLQTRLR